MRSSFKRQARADDFYRVTLGGGSILIQRIKHLSAIAQSVAIIHLMTLTIAGLLHLARSVVAKRRARGRPSHHWVMSPLVLAVMNERRRPR